MSKRARRRRSCPTQSWPRPRTDWGAGAEPVRVPNIIIVAGLLLLMAGFWCGWKAKPARCARPEPVAGARSV
eukprot:4588763-Lingulodinium_polyedra.AAC.1